MKATAIAPSNIAFVKYWGKIDEKLNIPENGSVSMNLSNLFTKTTVEFNPDFSDDEIIIDNNKVIFEKDRIIDHLNRIREFKKSKLKAKVVSINNFPSSTGLSSSASGFAALSLAGTKALGLSLSEKKLSVLARLGSGSACRSIPDGFVEWKNGKTNNSSYAVSIFSQNYWNIIDLVVIVSEEKKDISTTEGQKHAFSSIFFEKRLEKINEKIKLVKKYIKEKDFTNFGEIIENEALELHAIMLTSRPSLIYWTEGTLKIMKLVKKWREKGLEVYFSFNTGQNIHLICKHESVNELKIKLKSIKEVIKIIENKPSIGARISNKHLF